MATAPETSPSATPPRSRPDATKPDWLEIKADGTAVVTLQFPLTISGVKTGALNMRRAKVRDRLAADKQEGSAAQEVHLFALLTDLAPEEIEDLDLSDYGRLTTTFRRFLQSSATATK